MRSRALLAGVALLAAAACSRQPAAPSDTASAVPSAAAPSASPTASTVPIRVETRGGSGQYVTIVETVHGRKVYTIRALSGSLQRNGTDEGTGDLEQPHITFVDRSGSTTVADAPKARVAERDKSVVMTGGVHARTSAGTVLTCDQLTYKGDIARFYGEGHVRLTSSSSNGEIAIGGDRIDGDVKLQDVKITRKPG